MPIFQKSIVDKYLDTLDARGLYNINTDQSNLLSKLKYIIEIADEIEGNYTGDDLIDNI